MPHVEPYSRTCGRIIGLVVVVLASLLFPASSVSASRIESRLAVSPLRDCVSERGHLAVLFLIDESKSLRKTDGDNRRVAALQAAVSALSFNVGWATTKGDPYKIDVALSGFGTDYSKPAQWFQLSENPDDVLNDVIDNFASRNTSSYTDYEVALKGAAGTFKSREDSSIESCKVLVWLSDGKLDVDGEKGKKTLEAAEKLCEPEGVADLFREEGIYLVGFGLSASGATAEADFDLMEGISTGSNSCGAQEGFGQFRLVEGAEGLISDLFSDLSPYPPEDEEGRPCRGEESNSECFEFSFKTRPPLSRLKMLVSAASGIDSAEVVAPSLVSTLIIQAGKALEVSGASLKTTPLYERASIVSLTFPNGSRMHGEWIVRFRGPRATEASVSALFFSDIVATVAGGQPISLNRENPQPFVVEISEFGIDGLEESDSGAQVVAFDEEPTISATLVFGAKSIEALIKPLSKSKGSFEVTVAKNELAGLSALGSLWVEPRALLGGHEIRFSRSVFQVKLRAGEGMPDIISVTATKIDGKGSSNIVVKIEGSREGQGSATITNSLKVISLPSKSSGDDVSIEVKSGRRQIQSGESVDLEAIVSPNFEANGLLEIELEIELVGENGAPKVVPVSVAIEMDREISWWRLFRSAILMLAAFIGIQAALILIGGRRLARLRQLPSYTKVSTGVLEIRPDGSLKFDGGPPADIGKKWAHLGEELKPASSYVVGGITFQMFLGDAVRSLFRSVRVYVHAKRSPGDSTEVAIGDCGSVVRGNEAWALCRTSLQDSWVFVVDRSVAQDALETDRALIGSLTYVFGDKTDDQTVLGAEAETVIAGAGLRDSVSSLLAKFPTGALSSTVPSDLTGQSTSEIGPLTEY